MTSQEASQVEAPLRIGIIGPGAHGARYLRHLRFDVPGMAPAALCRRDHDAGERQAREAGCDYHRRPQDLIASPAVDGVVVCTPPSSHHHLCRQVLAAGKALLVEKPLTGTLAEARELRRLDAASALPLMLAQALRWNPVIRRARQLWPRLGRVRLVRCAQRLAPTTLAWQRDPAVSVGGSVLLTGVHIIDLVRHLTAREFTAIDSRQRNWLNPVLEDFFLARGELDDGAVVSLEVSKYTRSRAGLLEAVGEEGQLWADYLFGGVRLVSDRRIEEFAADASAPTLPGLLADWRDWLRARRQAPAGAAPPPPVTAEDGARTLAVVEACYRSQREAREVAVCDLDG